MSHRARMWSYIAAGAAIFLCIVAVIALRVAQSPWFANYVREKIVSTTEESTGGKTELGSFAFDWRHLQVTITNFAIHGTEPAGSAPFVYAKRIVVRLKLLASLKKTVDLSYLGVEQPSVNVIVNPDGSTNVPEPKVVRKSNKNPLETVVDLSIGKLDLTGGTVARSHRSLAFSANGEDVRAQLSYRSAPAGYSGDIRFGKVVYRPKNGSPLSASIDIPVEIAKDSIDVRGARLTTKESQINLTASLSHLNSPVISVNATGSVSLAEVQRSVNASMKPCVAGAPCVATLDLAARIDQESIQISNARLVAGASNLEASGALRGSNGNDTLQYQGTLALNEIGRLFQIDGDLEGLMRLSGHAQFRDAADYVLNGQIDVSQFAITEGASRVRDISLSSQVAATSHQIALTSIRLGAFKGEFDGNATLEDFAAFTVDGKLRNFSLREFEPPSAVGAYDGTINGSVEANGNLKLPGVQGLRAEARLTVVPGPSTGSQGVPVSGQINAAYDGATEQVRLQPSWIALPHSRLEVAGTVGKEVAVGFTSTNTSDLLPALEFSMESAPKVMPVTLRGGTLTLQAQVNGPISSPQITGHFATGAFAAGDRPFDRASADFSASPSGASIANGSVTRQSLVLSVSGSVGLSQWKTSEASPVQATLNLANGEIPDVLALSGQSDIPVTGSINASANVSGTIGNPQGAAHISAAAGTAYQQEFDRIDAQITLADQLIRLVSLDVADKSALIQASGTYTHPRDTLTTGRIAAHVAGNSVPLERVNAIEKLHPLLAGSLIFNGDVTGDITRNQGESEFVLTAVNADIRAQDLHDKDRRYGNLAARANTSGSNVTFDVASDLAGSTIKLNGRTTLAKDYPTTADADIQNLSVDSVLALAGQSFPVTGTLGFAGRISGTWRDPTGDGQITLTAAKLYGEPIDSLRGGIRYSAQLIEIPSMRMSAPAGGLSLSASFSHPQNQFTSGQFEVRVQAPAWNLAQIRTVQEQKPGLGGMMQVDADATGVVRSNQGGEAVLLTKLDGAASLKQIALGGRGYGDVTLTAKTNGDAVAIEADSTFGKSVIHGTGEATLTPDYPLKAQLSIGNLRFSNLREFIGAESVRPDVEALVEASASVTGPIARPSEVQGTLQISKFELSASRRGATGSTPTVALQNEGSITATLNGSRVAIQSAKLGGRGTEVAISGGAAFSGSNPMDLRVKATVDLGLLQDIDKTVYSSGSVALDAAVTGKYSDPSVNGNVQLKNASIQVEGIPNGISNANGSIALNGARASVQNLVAQSGGGKLTLTGSATRAGGSIRYSLRANAEHVRTRTQGISVVNSAVLTLSGTTERSVLSGDVSVERVGVNTQSDIGSSLAQAALPKGAATESSGALSAIRLDVRVRTAPDVQFQTTLAKTLNGTANLTLSGTAANPGVVGQINITEGNLVFFGNEYTVDHGSIAFYNPLAIEPRVELALDTTVKNIQVTLTLNGPIDDLKLSYTSDPPLQFDEIVGLLATGKRPSSDPAIVAHQAADPQQSVGEMGETAIVSQAVASPVSSRLQRVFGVNQLRIDPSFNSGSALPTARISLQQQISREITFTYTQDVSLANSELIRVEWIINPRFSAVATRDENGIFGVDFFYKRQFQ